MADQLTCVKCGVPIEWRWLKQRRGMAWCQTHASLEANGGPAYCAGSHAIGPLPDLADPAAVEAWLA